jgi:hypothetical protein
MHYGKLLYDRGAFTPPMPRIEIHDSLMPLLEVHCPEYLSLQAFCNQTIHQALTGQLTYAPTVSVRETNHSPVNASEPCVAGLAVPAAETAVPLETSFSTESNSTVRKKSRTQGSAEFQAFWKLYQSCPLKASNQRKNKAWDEWRKAIKIESPERLTKALENAIGAIRRGQNVDGWAAPLPDCFRWLRDGCYTAALEDNPAQDNYAANGITFLS